MPRGFLNGTYICQCGITFFPDRLTAMREIYRVLSPGGSVSVNVLRSLDRTPGFAALERAMANHVGEDAAAIVRSPFTIDTPNELATLAETAGFMDVRVVLDTRMVRFPSVKAFYNYYTHGSPLAAHVAEIDNHDDEVAEMAERLNPYIDSDGLAFPIEGLIVTASK